MSASMGTDVPPRSRLLPTYLAWTFGLGWGAALVGRLVVGPAGSSSSTLFGSGGLAILAWLAFGLLILLLPGLVAWRMALRWGVGLTEWGWIWTQDRRLLWGPAIAVSAFVAVYITALVVRPVGWSPSLLTLSSLPAALLSGAFLAALSMLCIELGFRGVVQTELARHGFVKSSLAAGAAEIAWVAGIAFLCAGRVEIHGTSIGDLDGVVLGVAALAAIGWAILASWARVRAGSVVASAMMFGVWSGLEGVVGSPLNVEGIDSGSTETPESMLAAVGVVTAVLAIAALLHPPTHDRWPRRPPRRHRAEDVLAEPVSRRV